MDFQVPLQLIAGGLKDGLFSAATFAVAVGGKTVHEGTVGRLSFEHGAPVADPNTLFDVASLTKPVATASAIMKLVEQGRMTLVQSAVADLEPVYGPLPSLAGVEARHLLTHMSGLPPIPQSVDGTPTAWAERHRQVYAATTSPLLREPGLAFTYSDTGYIALGEIVAAVAGQPLDEYAAENLFEPLALSSTRFCPKGDNIAATDPTVPAGTVHDPRARDMDGVAGHAGLFSTARDILAFAESVRKGGAPILSRATVARFAVSQIPVNAGAMSYGWFVNANDLLPRGDLFSDASYGHSGFTGCLMMIDPTYDVSVVLLTNRVLNTSVEGVPFLRLRRRWLNAIAAAITT